MALESTLRSFFVFAKKDVNLAGHFGKSVSQMGILTLNCYTYDAAY